MLISGLVSLISLITMPLFAVTVQSTICQPLVTPIFNSGVSETANATQIISGSASSNITVSIFDNNQQIATLTSDSTGNFSVQVSLVVGDNIFSATSKDDCSSITSSTPLVVIRNSLPVAPISFPSTSTPDIAISTLPAPKVTNNTQETVSANNSTSTQLVKPSIIDITNRLTLRLIPPSDPRSTTSVNSENSKTTINTTDESVFLRGLTEPSAVVTIIDNSHKVAQTTAARDGSFGISIPLLRGTNILSIEASLAGNVTTQILIYIRNPTANPWLMTGPIVSIAFVGIVVIAVILRRRLRSYRKKR